MILRLLLLLVIVLLVLNLLGRWRLPKPRSRQAIEPAKKCPDCGAYVLGSPPEPCALPDCRFRTAG